MRQKTLRFTLLVVVIGSPRDRDVYVVLVLGLKLLVCDLFPVFVQSRRPVVFVSNADFRIICGVLNGTYVGGNGRVFSGVDHSFAVDLVDVNSGTVVVV